MFILLATISVNTNTDVCILARARPAQLGRPLPCSRRVVGEVAFGTFGFYDRGRDGLSHFWLARAFKRRVWGLPIACLCENERPSQHRCFAAARFTLARFEKLLVAALVLSRALDSLIGTRPRSDSVIFELLSKWAAKLYFCYFLLLSVP